jgi:hypothetical protein
MGLAMCLRLATLASGLVPKMAMALGGIGVDWGGLMSHGAISLFEGAMVIRKTGRKR